MQNGQGRLWTSHYGDMHKYRFFKFGTFIKGILILNSNNNNNDDDNNDNKIKKKHAKCTRATFDQSLWGNMHKYRFFKIRYCNSSKAF